MDDYDNDNDNERTEMLHEERDVTANRVCAAIVDIRLDGILRWAPMKLAMTLLVRDEGDILREHLAFHRAQGVDRFLVMDHHSVDDTADILRDYERAGIAEVFRQDDPGYYQGRWVTWMARRAASKWGADWVINGDADEFWWPLKGNLKTALRTVPRRYSVVEVPRFDFAPSARSVGRFYKAMVWRDTESVNVLGVRLRAKVCHRGHPMVEVDQGNHDARFPGSKCLEGTAPLEILHFPMRSLEQIERKIRAGGRAYEQSPAIDPYLGDAWRHLYEELQRGGLAAYFDARVAEPEAEVGRGAARRFERDTRLKDYLSGLDLRAVEAPSGSGWSRLARVIAGATRSQGPASR